MRNNIFLFALIIFVGLIVQTSVTTYMIGMSTPDFQSNAHYETRRTARLKLHSNSSGTRNFIPVTHTHRNTSIRECFSQKDQSRSRGTELPQSSTCVRRLADHVLGAVAYLSFSLPRHLPHARDDLEIAARPLSIAQISAGIYRERQSLPTCRAGLYALASAPTRKM